MSAFQIIAVLLSITAFFSYANARTLKLPTSDCRASRSAAWLAGSSAAPNRRRRPCGHDRQPGHKDFTGGSPAQGVHRSGGHADGAPMVTWRMVRCGFVPIRNSGGRFSVAD